MACRRALIACQRRKKFRHAGTIYEMSARGVPDVLRRLTMCFWGPRNAVLKSIATALSKDSWLPTGNIKVSHRCKACVRY